MATAPIAPPPPAPTAPTALNPPIGTGYRARTPRCLARFLHILHHTRPELTQTTVVIYLQDDLDSPGSSYVYELLYGKGYDLQPFLAGEDETGANVVENGQGPGDIVKSGVNWRAASTRASRALSYTVIHILMEEYQERPSLKYKQHPFVRAREDIFLTTMEDDLESVKEAGLEVYVRTVASLLSVCENLETLYLPRAWKEIFPTQDFPRLRNVLVTEHLDEWREQVRQTHHGRRDSGLQLFA